MRHEERQREETSEPSFGTESPIVSPYPRDVITKDQTAPIYILVAFDLMFILIGASLASMILTFSSEGIALPTVILACLGAVRLHFAYRSRWRIITPHHAIGMTFAGFLFGAAFVADLLPNSPTDDDMRTTAMVFVVLAAMLTSILISVVAGIFRLKGEIQSQHLYDAVRRAATSSPFILSSSYILLIVMNQDKGLPSDWIAVPHWSLVLLWSLAHPPKLQFQLLFGAAHAVLFSAAMFISTPPFGLSVTGLDIVTWFLIGFVILSILRAGIATLRTRRSPRT